MANVRIVIIGSGRIANEHARAFSDVSDCQIVGVVGRQLLKVNKFATEFNIPHSQVGLAGLFEATNADLVVIAVDIDQTAGVLKECAKHKWTILTEKPLGINFREATELQTFLGANTERVLVALNRRHYSTVRKLETVLNQNSERRTIKIVDQEDQFVASQNGISDLTIENWMYANSIHLIDLFKVFGRGEISKINVETQWKSMSKLTHKAQLIFDSGDIGFYECFWNSDGPWSVSVSVGGESWLLKPLEKLTHLDHFGEETTPTLDDRWDLDFKAGFRRQAEMVVRRVRGLESDVVSFNEALKSMFLVKEIYGCQD